MQSVEGPKRRAGARYIVGGEAIFHTGSHTNPHTGSPEFCGELVNVGQRGILVRTNMRAPEGTDFQLSFRVEGYPDAFQARGEVAGYRRDLLAVKFLTEPAGMAQLLQWLSQENIPWTGLDSLESTASGFPLRSSSDKHGVHNAPSATQELEAILPFIEAMG
jgi:hypothetical protein